MHKRIYSNLLATTLAIASVLPIAFSSCAEELQSSSHQIAEPSFSKKVRALSEKIDGYFLNAGIRLYQSVLSHKNQTPESKALKAAIRTVAREYVCSTSFYTTQFQRDVCPESYCGRLEEYLFGKKSKETANRNEP